jgi:hypothetical protein
LPLNQAPPGYKVPSRQTLVRKLHPIRHNLDRLLRDRRSDPLFQRTGGSLSSDGWTDGCARPLLNAMLTTTGGSEFIAAFNTEGQAKDAAYLSDILSSVINTLGPENIVQINTDNAANCKAAGALLEDKFPHIFWAACAAHSLDLLLEDIGKVLPWAADVSRKIKTLTNFIRRHQWSLALYRRHSKDGHKKALLRPAETRFATECIAVGRALEVRPAGHRRRPLVGPEAGLAGLQDRGD